MTIKELMKTPVATCHPETNLAEASALLWENDCGALPVVGEAGELLGIVTDRDICIALGTRNVRPSDLHVADVAQNHLAVCRTTDDVHTALQDMRLRKVRRLPVLGDDSRVEGILSMDDVVLAAERDGGMGSGISYGDAITTLKLIYQKGDEVVV